MIEIISECLEEQLFDVAPKVREILSSPPPSPVARSYGEGRARVLGPRGELPAHESSEP